MKYNEKGKFQTSFTIIAVSSYKDLWTDIDVKMNVWIIA